VRVGPPSFDPQLQLQHVRQRTSQGRRLRTTKTRVPQRRTTCCVRYDACGLVGVAVEMRSCLQPGLELVELVKGGQSACSSANFPKLGETTPLLAILTAYLDGSR